MDFEICLKTLKTTEKNVTTPIFKAKMNYEICLKAPKMSVQKCDHPLFSGQKQILGFVCKLLKRAYKNLTTPYFQGKNGF